MSDQSIENSKTTRLTLGLVVSWVLSVLFGLGGVLEIAGGNIAGGAIAVLIGVVLLPLTSTWLHDRLKLSISGGLKFGIVVALLIVSAAVQTKSNTASAGATASPSSTAANAAPIQISAVDLKAAYDKNAVAADATYKGKPIEVTGIIDTIAATSSATHS